jgi:AraC-like DNA-binding protein
VEYWEFAPAAELKPYVRCYWTLRSAAPIESEPVLPDGRFELVFHLGDPFVQIRDGSRAIQPDSALVADLRKPVTIQPSGRADVLGVRFHAGGAYPFFRAPLRELEGEVRPLSDAWSATAERVRSRLGETGDDRARIAVLDRELLRRLHDAHSADRDFDRLVAVLRRSDGHCEIPRLAAAAGVSVRQLERRFLSRVGVSPKVFARLLRFRRVVHHIRLSPSSWLDPSLDLGFFDQSHLIHDFREFAGMTPRSFIDRTMPLNRVFADMSHFSNPDDPALS